MFCSLFVLCGLKPVYAESVQSISQLSEMAISSVKQLIPENYTISSIKTNRIDNRIRLQTCQNPLQTQLPQRYSIFRPITVAISCNQPFWKIHIHVRSEILGDVLISKQAIFRNNIINEQDVMMVKRPLNSYSAQNYLHDKNLVIGKIARRDIAANVAFRTQQLKANFWVKRKQSVLIIAKNENFEVRMRGVALANANLHDIVAVKNNSSNKKIEGMVIERGVVQVNY